MPLPKLESADLKCKNKNQCEYYGNPQWQGYCSKCHREQVSRQRRADKAKEVSKHEKSSSSATLPKPERKPERSLKLNSSFSRFEEKRLRQTETLKKANLLKLSSVFKKSSTDEHELPPDRRPPEFKIPAQVFEGMKREFRIRFPSLPQQVDRDCRAFVNGFALDTIRCAGAMPVDELSELVQRHYQRFMKYMDTSSHFTNVETETKELLIDFVEKHAMTYLHELPSVVFSPNGTDDERLDRAMSERIQQLSWVGERHLECRLDKTDARCRHLLYTAISELLGMDRAWSPGGKLARVRRCCRHVLALCSLARAPASADDLLPALIFTVLKANPPRLVSNINFVTRFCNAQRLMTGEGGYYFTNLCCAVSFIENLSADSLNMDRKEFDCYMAMPATIGGSSWACALSLCGAAREADEQRAQAQQLCAGADRLTALTRALADDATTFEEQIAMKVQDVLSRTPLEITPRRELPRLDRLRDAPLLDLSVGDVTHRPSDVTDHPIEVMHRPSDVTHTTDHTNHPSDVTHRPSDVTQTNDVTKPTITQQPPEDTKEEKLTILGFEEIDNPSPSKSWDKQNSMELLTPSPLGFTPFDSRSIDELMTPDDFGSDMAPGLSNINYDIDLSDFSGDNSIAEDKPKDPFSPEALKTFDPFAPQEVNKITDAFDEFSLVDSKSNTDPFELVPRDPFSPIQNQKKDPFSPNQKDPFSPVTQKPQDPFSVKDKSFSNMFDPVPSASTHKAVDLFDPIGFSSQQQDPFSPDNKESSILDDSGSPTAACLLPLPLQPQNKQT